MPSLIEFQGEPILYFPFLAFNLLQNNAKEQLETQVCTEQQLGKLCESEVCFHFNYIPNFKDKFLPMLRIFKKYIINLKQQQQQQKKTTNNNTKTKTELLLRIVKYSKVQNWEVHSHYSSVYS